MERKPIHLWHRCSSRDKPLQTKLTNYKMRSSESIRTRMQQKRGYVGRVRSYPRQIPFWLDLTYIMQASAPPCVCGKLSQAHIKLARYLHTSGCIDTWLTSYCHPPCRSQTAPAACLITRGRSPECMLQILWLIRVQRSRIDSMNHVSVCRYLMPSRDQIWHMYKR